MHHLNFVRNCNSFENINKENEVVLLNREFIRWVSIQIII